METTEHLDTPEQREFRLKARAWMQGRLPPRLPDEPIMDWDDKALVAKDKAIQRMLWDGGLAGVTLPVAYGGLGLDGRFERVLHEEAQPYRLPWSFGNAFNVVVPTVLAHGSETLKKRYIPGILRGDELWCQLLSEPSGGSDLAGLLTRAERRGDDWVLNGSKVWTTGGNGCDMAICLARTDPDVPKHAGLTMFLVNMHAAGVSISPIRLIDRSADFCQEFLDDVVVPGDHVVGEVNGGWTVARTLMANEHAGVGRGWHIGLGRVATAQRLDPPATLIEQVRSLGRAEDARARQIFGEAWVMEAVSFLTSRRVADGMKSGALPHAIGDLSKLMSARIGARRSGLMSELAGPAGVAAPLGNGQQLGLASMSAGGEGVRVGLARVMTHTIGGGTQEMSMNMVSERLLDLPREPSPDRDLPFSQIRKNAAPQRG